MDVRAFTSRSMSDGRPNDTITAASFLGPYAGVIDHLGETLDHFDRIAQLVDFMMPSFDPQCNGFDSQRYWRGPVWAVVNNRIGVGLREIGEVDRCAAIRRGFVKTLISLNTLTPSVVKVWGDSLGRRRSILIGPLIAAPLNR